MVTGKPARFFDEVYAIVGRIPAGKVTTYGHGEGVEFRLNGTVDLKRWGWREPRRRRRGDFRRAPRKPGHPSPVRA